MIPVTFTPSTETAESATLSVSIDQDPTSPHSIALTGTGITPVRLAPPATVAFGTVAMPKSKALTVTVTNLGTATLTLPTPMIGGANAADFSLTASALTPCGATLAGGSSCNVGVTFTPSVAAPESASIAISASPDAASPHQLESDGHGFITDYPDDLNRRSDSIAPAVHFSLVLPAFSKCKTICNCRNSSPRRDSA